MLAQVVSDGLRLIAEGAERRREYRRCRPRWNAAHFGQSQ